MSNPKQVYQLKVILDDVKSPIWRRLVVKEDINLLTLHEIIQRAMGWQDYHLHMFTIAGQIYGDPVDDEFGDLGTKNETHYKLNKLGLGKKPNSSTNMILGTAGSIPLWSKKSSRLKREFTTRSV
jgi:hypothetical protein